MIPDEKPKDARKTIHRVAVLALALAVPSYPLATHAQGAGKIPKIGFLHSANLANAVSAREFFHGLRELGYVEGRNITILRRSARGDRRRLAEMAAELVREKVDVIVTHGGAAPTAIEATSTVPIVVSVAGDYVARGWAESLGRPGGNVTGLSTQAAGLMGKQLQLLKETVPGLTRVAILAVAGHRGHAEQIGRATEAAPVLGLGIVAIRVEGPADLPAAFHRMKGEGVDGMVVLRHGTFVHARDRITTLARAAGLPSLFGHVVEAEAGGLMAYGADTQALFRGAAAYVDRILKGADPAELPISQATKFNLTVNLRTAKALDITFPRSLLLRADRVIE